VSICAPAYAFKIDSMRLSNACSSILLTFYAAFVALLLASSAYTTDVRHDEVRLGQAMRRELCWTMHPVMHGGSAPLSARWRLGPAAPSQLHIVGCQARLPHSLPLSINIGPYYRSARANSRASKTLSVG
jgi:hypothetical protein